MSGFKPYYTAYSDVWALGVILVNMVSGRNPWERATLDDPCFIQFIENPDFLFEVLPISEGANDILRQAFVLNPLSRISISALRRAVLELDTFFRYEDELTIVNEYVQDVPATFGNPQGCPDSVIDSGMARSVCPAGPPEPKESSPGTMSADRARELSMRPSCHPTLPVTDCPGLSSRSTASSTTSDESSPASSLVVTPETTAVGPGPGCDDGSFREAFGGRQSSMSKDDPIHVVRYDFVSDHLSG